MVRILNGEIVQDDDPRLKRIEVRTTNDSRKWKAALLVAAVAWFYFSFYCSTRGYFFVVVVILRVIVVIIVIIIVIVIVVVIFAVLFFRKPTTSGTLTHFIQDPEIAMTLLRAERRPKSTGTPF